MFNPFKLFRSCLFAQKRRSILYRMLSLVLLSAITFSTLASQFYRYKNENNQLVLSQTLPAKYADKGYDIINEKGRLLKTIPQALTPEEIKKRDAVLEIQRLALIEQKKQDAEDEELKQLYSQPNDAVRVLNRHVLDIQGAVEIKRNKIKNLKSQIMYEESRAAGLQRKGFPVGEDALQKLSSLKKDITNADTDINELYTKLDNVVKDFDLKIKRLEVITPYQATNYPEVLKIISELKLQ
jgi:hypothetical protein